MTCCKSEQHGEGVHQHFAKQPVAEMPEIVRLDTLDCAPLHQLAKDGIDSVAQTADPLSKTWMRVTLRPAERRNQTLPLGA